MHPADLIPLREVVQEICAKWDLEQPNDPFRYLGTSPNGDAHFARLVEKVNRKVRASGAGTLEWRVAIALAYFATAEIWPRTPSAPLPDDLLRCLDEIVSAVKATYIPSSMDPSLAAESLQHGLWQSEDLICAQVSLAYLVGWRRSAVDRRSPSWSGVPKQAQRVFCNEILREIVDSGLNFFEGRESQNADYIRKRAGELISLQQEALQAEADLDGLMSDPATTKPQLESAKDLVIQRRAAVRQRAEELRHTSSPAHEGSTQRIHGFPSSQPREPWICRVYHLLCSRKNIAVCRCGKAFCNRYHHIDRWLAAPLSPNDILDPVSLAAGLRNPSQPIDNHLRLRLAATTSAILNQWNPTLIEASNVVDFPRLAQELKNPSLPISRYIRERLSPRTLELLSQWEPRHKTRNHIRAALAADLDALSGGEPIFQAAQLDSVRVGSKANELLRKNRKDVDTRQLNVYLLEDSYPGCFVRKVPSDLLPSLVRDLNFILAGHSLWDEGRFEDIALRKETKALAALGDSLRDPHRLNRILLEDSHPSQLQPSHQEPLLDFLRQAVLGAKTIAAAALARGLLVGCLKTFFAKDVQEVGGGQLEAQVTLEQVDIAVWDCPRCQSKRGRNLWVNRCPDPDCEFEFDRAEVKLRAGRAFFVLLGPAGHFELTKFGICHQDACGNLFVTSGSDHRCPICSSRARPKTKVLAAYRPLLPLIDLCRAGGYDATPPPDIDAALPLDKLFETVADPLVRSGMPDWLVAIVHQALRCSAAESPRPTARKLFVGTQESREEFVEEVTPVLWPEGKRPFTPHAFEDAWLTYCARIQRILCDYLAPPSDQAPGPNRLRRADDSPGSNML